jgi:internalin A
MTPEEEEALRRVRKAEETGSVTLDLAHLSINRVPRELTSLTSLRSVDLSYCRKLSDLSPLADLASLQSLDLHGCEQLDLSGLASLSSLQSLDLRWCTQLSDHLSHLASLHLLRSLDISYCGLLRDLSPLASLTLLERLQLSQCGPIGSLSPLSDLVLLRNLNLLECTGPIDLTPLAKLILLQDLDISRCTSVFDLSPLTTLGSLTKLSIKGWTALDTLHLLTHITSLQELDLSFSATFIDLSSLPSLSSLKLLDLNNCYNLCDISFFHQLGALEIVNLTACHKIVDFSPLASLTSLQKLYIAYSDHVIDLAPLASLTSLLSLNVSSRRQITDVSPLTNFTSLQHLDLSNCYQITDLVPLASLTSLLSLNLSGCGQVRDVRPLANITLLRQLNLSKCQFNELAPLASLTSLLELNLSGCDQIVDLSVLSNFLSLQQLALSGCVQISDLSPLANLASIQELDLTRCEQINDVSVLAHFKTLRILYLSGCQKIADFSHLAGLTSLQELNLSGCTQLRDVSFVAVFTKLRNLRLEDCVGVRHFGSLKRLLPTLRTIGLTNCQFEDLPVEVCGKSYFEHILDYVRAHFADLEYGERIDAELKVFFLGNGGVGKTQLCRRLRGLEFDPSDPTTHGVELGRTTVTVENYPERVRLNLWDFGGQDIYHGSHALFLQGQAIFLILWIPELEHQTTYQEGALSFRHRPLSYWLDYLRAFAGTDASVLIVQSQCDTRDKRVLHPPAPVDDFPFHRFTEVSARTGLNLGILKESIKEAVRDRFDRRRPPRIGVGRLKVRDRLRQMLEEDQKREPDKRQNRLLEREDFDRLCVEMGGVSDPSALLDFLHNNGVIFYRPGLFQNQIILDQNWALKAIYSIFHRDKCFKQLKKLHGRFSREDLELLIWSGYTPEEQNAFLGMMESCGICFEVRKLPNGEREYLAPELLPGWSDAQEQLLGRLRDDFPDAQATARYAFLHEGVLRGFLSKLGEHAKDAAIYWKYGCWFFEQKTRSQVLIESKWDHAESESAAGTIRCRAWGENAEGLIDPLLEVLRKLPVGQPPEIKRAHNATVAIKAVAGVLSYTTVEAGAGSMEIPSRPKLPPKSTPEIFISYAWGDDSSEDARKRSEVVDRLCETLALQGWNILRDKTVMRYGDLISVFMKRISLADHVIVVLSDKYLRSPYCMTELYSIYQRSVGEKEDFLRRIIPLRLADAQISAWRGRVAYAEYWEAEFKAMEDKFRHLAEADFRLYKAMQEWHNRIGDMLAYVIDVLSPHGFDEVVKDDFAALRQMLQGRR